jgi:hypothetical protein
VIVILALLAADDALGRYRELTRAETRCARPSTAEEVTVCGRREADRRYRVPLVGIPVRDQVPRERAQLLEPKLNTCGRVGMSFAECGFVGVTMSSGGAGTTLKPRKLAP